MPLAPAELWGRGVHWGITTTKSWWTDEEAETTPALPKLNVQDAPPIFGGDPLSKMISALETELRFTLFNRSTRRLSLTEAAQPTMAPNPSTQKLNGKSSFESKSASWPRTVTVSSLRVRPADHGN